MRIGRRRPTDEEVNMRMEGSDIEMAIGMTGALLSMIFILAIVIK